mmetsp:Transcript_13991/g.45670  ORF Transcript_13991/g.45670 Transcript_13991/m.45670 type:complete len:209 (+) Transcript_13991:102-728(+)
MDGAEDSVLPVAESRAGNISGTDDGEDRRGRRCVVVVVEDWHQREERVFGTTIGGRLVLIIVAGLLLVPGPTAIVVALGLLARLAVVFQADMYARSPEAGIHDEQPHAPLVGPACGVAEGAGRVGAAAVGVVAGEDDLLDAVLHEPVQELVHGVPSSADGVLGAMHGGRHVDVVAAAGGLRHGEGTVGRAHEGREMVGISKERVGRVG